MKIKEFRDWINNVIPAEFDDFDLVMREAKVFPNDEFDDEDDYLALKDSPIASCGIDEEHKEGFLMDSDSTVLVEDYYSEDEENVEKPIYGSEIFD